MSGIAALGDFHFLRPLWLLALLPAAVLALMGWRALRAGRDDWRGLVDAHLLRHLAVRGESGGQRGPLLLLLAGWVLASLAMAGPTWQRLPTPALGRLDPTVMVLNLGRSMDATDQAPSRLTAARHKMDDVLGRMRGGQVGLIVYADVPFVAAPLTEDGRIIAQMLPELATDLMPVAANRPDLAIHKAMELLQGAGAREGRIVLVTDGLGDDPDKTLAAAEAAAKAGYRLSVIGVGTVTGAALKGPDGEVVRGAGGAPVLTRMDKARLTQLAAEGHGAFTPLSVDGRDLDAVLASAIDPRGRNPVQDSGMTADQWADMGPYLLVLLLVVAPLAFRRGLILALLGAVLAASHETARAQDFDPPPSAAAPALTPASAPAERPALAPAGDTRWADLWRRPDQQGADAYAAGDYAGAATRFEDPRWKASALYKAGRYEDAASAYAGVPGGDYNRGNALARAGKLEDAISAYDAALKADPADKDALFNRDLVQQILKRQKDEQKKNQSGGGAGQGGGGQGGGQQNDQKSSGKGQSGGKGDNTSEQKPDSGKQNDAKPKDGNKDQAKPDQGKQDPKKQDSGKQEQNKPDDGKGQGEKPNAPKPESKPDSGPDGKAPKPADPSQGAPKPQPPAAPPRQPSAPARPEPPKDEGANAPQGPGHQPAAPKPEPARPVGPGSGEEAGKDDEKGQPATALRPMSEQDQNSEQALRMVPDDPAGLLRARIRAYYGGNGAAVQDEDN